MGLDKEDVIDTVGIERETGLVILTIADSWDWDDSGKHLLALQAKLNAYFRFIETGQVWESYPEAANRELAIEVVSRFPMPPIGSELLKWASEACAPLGVTVRSRYYHGPEPPCPRLPGEAY